MSVGTRIHLERVFVVIFALAHAIRLPLAPVSPASARRRASYSHNCAHLLQQRKHRRCPRFHFATPPLFLLLPLLLIWMTAHLHKSAATKTTNAERQRRGRVSCHWLCGIEAGYERTAAIAWLVIALVGVFARRPRGSLQRHWLMLLLLLLPLPLNEQEPSTRPQTKAKLF